MARERESLSLSRNTSLVLSERQWLLLALVVVVVARTDVVAAAAVATTVARSVVVAAADAATPGAPSLTRPVPPDRVQGQ
jgi:hypothetical protein